MGILLPASADRRVIGRKAEKMSGKLLCGAGSRSLRAEDRAGTARLAANRMEGPAV
jgi:hypothetical protein